MSRYDFPGQAAAARAYDDACDCCDHGPIRAPEIEREPSRDTYREWAGVESRPRPRRFIPSNWFEGCPF